MKVLSTTLATACTLALATTATAQGLQINEVYASHGGTDDREYVEITGPAGFNLDDCMILIVEGQGAGQGTLDRAWDLSGFVMPSDGYFVVGDDLVANLDLSVGATNTIENGTETIYLILANDVPTVTALLGTNVATGPGTTSIPTLGIIRDVVALTDEADIVAAGDDVYDGATLVGPDGSFFPAGIYRGVDAPNGWCMGQFLDFDPDANANQPRTPGTQNVNCDAETNTYCVAQVNSLGCTPTIAGTGTASAGAGSGYDIDGGMLMEDSFAILAYSTTGTDASPFGGGTLCVAMPSRSPVINTGGSGACTGTANIDFNAYVFSGVDAALVAGVDVYAQWWSRDSGDSNGTNTTSAIAFNIGS